MSGIRVWLGCRHRGSERLGWALAGGCGKEGFPPQKRPATATPSWVPAERENQNGDGKPKGLRPLLHLTPSPASHPIPCIPPHLLHPTPSLIPACPQGGRLGLGTGVSTTLGSEGEGLVTDVLYLRKAEGSREEKPRDAHSMGGLSTGAEA